MNNSQPHQEREATLFEMALEKTGPEREAFLRALEVDDAALYVRLKLLLAANEREDGPLAAPTDSLCRSGKTWSEAPMPDEAVGQTIGRYKLLEKLGEGGCGMVYVAEQTEPVRRRVALKVIKLGMDSKAVVARFEAERQALALMDHPNIAHVIDGGTTENGRPYFVMELVRGIKITDFCDQHKLPTKERLRLFMQVCHAIQHAHQKGIIHRDIKPSNILVTRQDGEPVPKVIDFGVAKATAGRLTDATVYTQLHQLIGTPAYMSPEQAEMTSVDVDTRSDIYSLGVLLYELLTGRTPFDAKELVEAGLEEMRRIIREKEPARPSTKLSTLGAEEQTRIAKRRQVEAPRLIHQVRGDLDWIVMKCLEKDRARRYEAASGLALDVERHLRNEPIAARSPRLSYRFLKTVRRHLVAFAAAAAIAGALSLGVVVSSWWALKATRAKQEASRLFAQAEKARAEEARQHLLAEAQRQRAEDATAQIGIQSAEIAFNADDALTALAYLARTLRNNPTNYIAADRIVSALTHRSFALPIAHYVPASCAAFSPDGEKIAVAWGKTAQVLEVKGGRPLARMEHQETVSFLAFSKDGSRIVTVAGPYPGPQASHGVNSAVRVWDAHTGQPVTEWLTGHTDLVNSASFSANGELLVTVCRDKTARVWSTRTGEAIGQPLQHGGEVTSAHFSAGELRLLTVCRDGTARIWEPITGKLLLGSFTNNYPLNWGQFSPNAQLVVVAADNGTAQVRDAQTGRVVSETLRQAKPITLAEFSPDGNRIITVCRDYTARVWDARTGRPLTDSLRHHDSISSAHFDPTGERIVTASWDGTARVWDARTSQPLTEPIGQKGLGGLRSAEFSSDGQRLITVSFSKAQIWDVRAGQAMSSILKKPVTAWSDSVHFSPDGQRVLTESAQGVEVWNSSDGSLLTRLPIVATLPKPGQTVPISPAHAQFSPDGRRVVSLTDAQKTVQVWDAFSGSQVSAPMKHDQIVSFLEFSHDGKRLLTGTEGGVIMVWDAESGRLAVKFSPEASHSIYGHFNSDGSRIAVTGKTASVRDATSGLLLWQTPAEEAWCHEARFSPDSKLLLTASYQTVRLWKVESGKAFGEPLRHLAQVLSALFSPDGHRIVTVAADNTAQVWEVGTGRPVGKLLPHGQRISCAAFSYDGKRLVTATADEAARVWDVETGQPLTDCLRHGGPVQTIEFSPDGKWLAAAVWGRRERYWEIPSLRPVPEWLADLAEAVAGLRISERGTFELVPASEIRRLSADFKSRSDSDASTRWAQWFFADRDNRRTSPSSNVSVQEHVRCLTSGARSRGYGVHVTADILREAVLLAPTNRVLVERLARERNEGNAFDFNVEAWRLVMGPQERRDPKRAVESAEQAVHLVSSSGSDVQTKAACLNTLGIAYYRAGQFPNATKALLEAAVLNRGGRFYSEAMDFLFLCLSFHQQGEVLRGRYYRARTADILGQTLSEMNAASADDPELQSALNETEKLLGPVKPSPAESLIRAAIAFRKRGKLQEAEMSYSEAIALQKDQHVDDDPTVACWCCRLAEIFEGQQKWAQATTAYDEALGILTRLFGKETLEVADLLSQEGMALQKQGKRAEAEASEREALTIKRKQFGAEHTTIATTLVTLGQILQEECKLVEAEATYREALAIQRQVLGERDKEVAASLMLLSRFLIERGNFGEAESTARESLSIREEAMPDDWRTFYSRTKVGSCLLVQKRYAEAEPFLLSGYKGMKTREGTIPTVGKPRLNDAAQDLATLYEAIGRPEQAAFWTKIVDESPRQ